MNTKSEKTYNSYELFKPIRNQISKYSPIDVAIFVSTIIRKIEYETPDQWKGWLPWHLFNILKWGFEFGEEAHPENFLTNSRFVSLANKVKEFEKNCGNPFLDCDKLRSIEKFFRRISFQQFWFQERIDSWRIARQYLIFCKLFNNSYLNDYFLAKANISISEFLFLSILVWSWSTKYPKDLYFKYKDIFSNIKFPEIVKDSYMQLLSLNVKTAKEYVTSPNNKIRNRCFQLFEPNIFIQKPFLTIDDRTLLYSKKLFEQSTTEYIYMHLKKDGSSRIAEEISRRFEFYVKESLKELPNHFLSENELKTYFPNIKTPDFLISCEKYNLIIEVKSSELRPSVQVFPDSHQLINELEDNVIKAVIQSLTLINELNHQKQFDKFDTSLPFFIMILTYKDLHLGNGPSMWNEFLFKALSGMLGENNELKELINGNNIAILSVNDFDLLVSGIFEGRYTFSDVIEIIIQDNLKPESMKWEFGQHLLPLLSQDMKHPFLDDQFENIVNEIKGKFRKINPSSIDEGFNLEK